jgi:non-specific serine/threonine protein kinase
LDQVVYRCGDCELDTANRTLRRSGSDQAVEPKVFAVLVQFLMHPGELLTRDQLLDAVWGHRYVTSSTLNRVIGLARRSLGDDVDQPKYIQTVHGSGYRFVGTVDTAAQGEPRAHFGPPLSLRLPAPLQTLIGRQRELKQIEAALDEGRSLTILGSGGMGKTQCALGLAHATSHRYADGVWFFDLAPLERAQEWLNTLALALAISPGGEVNVLGKVAEQLAERRALLLLDNCDRLSADLGALVYELLRGTRHVKILATSQQQLRFVSERVLRLPPLELPALRRPSNEHELQQVASAPAVELLLARIRDSQSAFRLDVANAPAIVDICERLDGMPLALELAAARFALLSAEQVLERLDQRFRFLVGEVSGRDHRHRNLIALLDWSFALLSPNEQRLLAWLGVFVQGWSVEGVIDLAPAFGVSSESAVDLMTGLADKSLVSVDQGISPPRYRLLETVREFALERLRLLGEEKLARDAHLAHVLVMAQTAHGDLLGRAMQGRIAQLRHEHGNINSASEYAAGPGENIQAALQITGLLTLYFKAHGEGVFAIRLCERALAGAAATRSRERALTQLCRGVSIFFGPKVAAEEPLLEAVSIARDVGDEWTEAYASGHLALWLIHFGQLQRAAEHSAAVDRLAESLGDDLLRGLAGLARGWLLLANDDNDAAIEELRAVRHLGPDFHQHHFVDMYFGLALFRRGDFAAAALAWHEAMRKALAVGHLRGVAGSIEGCAYIEARTGVAERACRFLSAAEEIRKRASSPLFSFWFAHNNETRETLRASLGSSTYEAALAEGALLRTEDVINDAAARLRQLKQDSRL